MQTTLSQNTIGWRIPLLALLWMGLQAYLTAWLSQALQIVAAGPLMAAAILAGVLAAALIGFFYWLTVGE